MSGTHQAASPIDPLLTPAQVMTAIGVSRTHFHRMVERGEFPAPIRVSPKCPRWRRGTVETFIADRDEAAA